MRKLQSQGVHHITLVGADRRTSIDFWEGVLGMPFVFEQPNLDNENESHLYFDPGDGRLITVFTNEERVPDPTRTATDPGCVHHIAFALSNATFRQAVERLEERGVEHSGVKDRGFMDSIYFEDPLGLTIELASYRFEPPHGFTHAEVLLEAHRLRVERGCTTSAGGARGRDRAPHRPLARVALRRPLAQRPVLEGGDMAANTLNILKPSVNNLTARVFVRAAGLDFEEVDVWGQTTGEEYLDKYPAHLTPMLETEALPGGYLGESCAIMTYLCAVHGLDDLYPRDPGERAIVDNAMYYLIGTLYPLITRATYPTLGFPQYPGEVGSSEASDELKAQAVEDATAALAEPLEVYNTFFLAGRPFIGGSRPSIADIRLAASLEFLRAIDYPFPRWVELYMASVEEALGEAYSEPVADVRGYIEYVRSQ